MSKRFLSPINLYNATSDPSSPVSGDIYFNSSTKKVRQYTGTAWEDVDTSAAGSAVYEYIVSADYALSNATGDQLIFDGKSVALPSGKTFDIVMSVAISCSGTTSATKSVFLDYSGSLSFIGATATYIHTAAMTTASGDNTHWISSVAAKGLGATSTTNNTKLMIVGSFATSTSGNFSPKFSYSVAPGAAPSVLAGSFIKISEKPSSAGTWA